MVNKLNVRKATIKQLRPLKDTIIVYGMDFNERMTQRGIILPDDDMKLDGIRPRWARVYALGPDIDYLKVGQYIMVSHGRWSRGQTIVDDEGEKVIRKVDPNDILLVSDEEIVDQTLSDKVI